ncbi:uncharacterized protein LOC132613913 [Lycium barbarum]|uniref:uncharacterized protein LOC132613913 n=1 Tax=Lycium barbarum TaxID=112863 RepID=UPI00293EEA42|nr:uncharacterized protein LOC132613913 [Lycium barbarum]
MSARCVLKVELRKAYAKFDWYFFKNMLIDLGFPQKIVHWVMECVNTVSYSLVINGGLAAPFRGKIGTRQGDLMSYYLFVLDMEYLQREMNQLARNPEFNFQSRCKRLGVIHICFAHDFLIFCMVDLKSVKLLQKTFQLCSNAFGFQENVDESSLYVTGVSSLIKADILQALGYVEVHFHSDT